MVTDLSMAVWMLRFLCQILHPNKLIRSPQGRKELEKVEKESLEIALKERDNFEKTAQAETPVEEELIIEPSVSSLKEKAIKKVAEEDWESVKKEVLTIVSKRYLEPSLKRTDVIRDVSYMKHTLAGTFITQVGFYKLVNAFRVRHYEQLMKTTAANLGQDAAAEMCGFKNRWALTNARKRLEGFDFSLIEDYVS